MTGVNIRFASGFKPQKKTYFVKIFRKSFVNAQKKCIDCTLHWHLVCLPYECRYEHYQRDRSSSKNHFNVIKNQYCSEGL